MTRTLRVMTTMVQVSLADLTLFITCQEVICRWLAVYIYS